MKKITLVACLFGACLCFWLANYANVNILTQMISGALIFIFIFSFIITLFAKYQK
jgi:hypothetical protein